MINKKIAIYFANPKFVHVDAKITKYKRIHFSKLLELDLMISTISKNYVTIGLLFFENGTNLKV